MIFCLFHKTPVPARVKPAPVPVRFCKVEWSFLWTLYGLTRLLFMRETLPTGLCFVGSDEEWVMTDFHFHTPASYKSQTVGGSATGFHLMHQERQRVYEAAWELLEPIFLCV